MKNKGCAKFVACVAVVGERENGRARGRHARGVSFWLACVASVSARACYAGYLLARRFFLCPLPSKRLLRRLIFKGYNDLLPLALVDQLTQRSCRSTTRLKHGLIAWVKTYAKLYCLERGRPMECNGKILWISLGVLHLNITR